MDVVCIVLCCLLFMSVYFSFPFVYRSSLAQASSIDSLGEIVSGDFLCVSRDCVCVLIISFFFFSLHNHCVRVSCHNIRFAVLVRSILWPQVHKYKPTTSASISKRTAKKEEKYNNNNEKTLKTNPPHMEFAPIRQTVRFIYRLHMNGPGLISSTSVNNHCFSRRFCVFTSQ